MICIRLTPGMNSFSSQRARDREREKQRNIPHLRSSPAIVSRRGEKIAHTVDAKSRNHLIITCLCQSAVAIFLHTIAHISLARILNIFMKPVSLELLPLLLLLLLIFFVAVVNIVKSERRKKQIALCCTGVRARRTRACSHIQKQRQWKKWS